MKDVSNEGIKAMQPVQRRGIGSDDILQACLARGMTIREAARLAGMSERTARRRLADPEFAQSVQSLTAQLSSEVAAGLTALAPEALRTLGELMRRGNKAEVRQRAATAVLTLGLRYREGQDAQRRLAVLESAALEHGAILAEIHVAPTQERPDAA